MLPLALFLADILVPVVGSFVNELLHQVLAPLVVHVDELNAFVLQPLFATNKVVVFTHDHPLDPVQEARPRAHGAGRQRGVHGTILVHGPVETTGVFQARSFPVQGGRPLLESHVVAAAQHGAVFRDQGSPDGDAAFLVALLCFFKSNLDTLSVVESHVWWWCD